MKNIIIINKEHREDDITELQAEFLKKHIKTVSAPPGIEVIQLPPITD